MRCQNPSRKGKEKKRTKDEKSRPKEEIEQPKSHDDDKRRTEEKRRQDEEERRSVTQSTVHKQGAGGVSAERLPIPMNSKGNQQNS